MFPPLSPEIITAHSCHKVEKYIEALTNFFFFIVCDLEVHSRTDGNFEVRHFFQESEPDFHAPRVFFYRYLDRRGSGEGGTQRRDGITERATAVYRTRGHARGRPRIMGFESWRPTDRASRLAVFSPGGRTCLMGPGGQRGGRGNPRRDGV